MKNKKVTIGSILLMLVALGFFAYDKFVEYCKRNPSDEACAALPSPSPSPTPEPTPSPTPTASPTPSPTPTPSPSPSPTPSPTPTPATSPCPKPLAPGAVVYINDKCSSLRPNGTSDGRCDSTPRVRGDLVFCQLIHGPDVGADCHLESWPKRTECELELMDGHCPVWEWTSVLHRDPQACLEDDPFAAGGMSCDHFGSPGKIDDPQTEPAFEGSPAECALLKDEQGNPRSGFFTIAHGDGEVRACLPHAAQCGPWRRVNH